MSDRKKAIETLKQLRLDYEEFHEEHNNEVTQAYDMAIASLETDEAYQLEYESTTNNDCETCIHNKGVLECDMYGCKYEPTTKNDLGVELIDRVELLKAMDTWDKFGYTETGCFVRKPKGDYVPYVHYDDMVNCVKGMSSVIPQEPIECKADDCISRKQAQDELYWKCQRWSLSKASNGFGQDVWNDYMISSKDAMQVLKDLPSVYPKSDNSVLEDIKAEIKKYHVDSD